MDGQTEIKIEKYMTNQFIKYNNYYNSTQAERQTSSEQSNIQLDKKIPNRYNVGMYIDARIDRK